jgi:hypothetical protein
MIGGCRKLHGKCIIRMLKSRMMTWAGHAACMGVKWNVYRIFIKIKKEDLDVGWKIILKLIFS